MVRNQKGMTLLEIMIVLVILGGLVAILGTQVTKQLAKARVKEARIQIAEVGKSLDMFYTDCGFYPQDLSALIEAPDDCSNWGPDAYLKKIPKDPWGTEYTYELEGGSYVLSSLGADKREGGKGNEADITSED